MKGRNVFNQFDEEAGWTGTLSEFNNQSMYAIKISTSAQNTALLYPVAPPARGVDSADSSGAAIARAARRSATVELAQADTDLTFDPADYQYDMTITAAVHLETGDLAARVP